MDRGVCEHLDEDRRVKLGAYYTPSDLVAKVRDLVSPYIEGGRSSTILDNAAGYGAFVEKWDANVRAADVDGFAVSKLRELLPDDRVVLANALMQPSRERYGVPAGDRLIVVGNPPYNDTTSEFRNGMKGAVEADASLADRDLGVSFLRSYDILGADVVCVLHPLSYLIKKANFQRLKAFRENYRLKRGLLFSSARFGKATGARFPVLIALYERGASMDYEYIQNFGFEIVGEDSIFRLARFRSTDGLINKYPARSPDAGSNDLGLFYYTFRDINSLKRNAGFMTKPHYNGIAVQLSDFYKYAYLHAFKRLFNPTKAWLYGNLSPLVDPSWLENAKRDVVSFALMDHPALVQLEPQVRTRIADYYQAEVEKADEASAIRADLESAIMKLAAI